MPTSSSLTAYVVTATVARLGSRPRWRGLLGDEALALADAFARHAPDTAVKRLVARMPAAVLVGLLERAFVPGMAWHYLFRKHWIEDRAKRAIASGAGQLVVLGGGFDSLALRLARAFPELTALEIDLPRTQARKRETLATIGHPVPPNVTFVPADLAAWALDEVLASVPAIRRDAATVVVIEGVLMYLDADAVRGLFRALHRSFGGDLSVLLGATATPDAAGDWRVRLVDRALARGGEGTSWACPAAEMGAFLAPLGFVVEEVVTYGDLQRRNRTEAEARHVPAEDENYYRVRKAGRAGGIAAP